MACPTNQTNFAYWDSVLQDLPDSYRNWFGDERKFLRANTPTGSRVLEIGCGDARSLRYIAGFGVLYGIDNNPAAVVSARRQVVEIPDITIFLEDGRDLPFRENLFDRVLCLTTPANFGNDRNKFYAEMKRTVKSGGEILLSVFNEDEFTFQERMKLYSKLGAPISVVRGTTVVFDFPDGAHTSEQFSEEELRGIFAGSSLLPVEIKKQGIGYFCRLRK